MPSFRSKAQPQETPFEGPAWWQAAIVLALAFLLQTEVAHYAVWRNAEPSLVLVALTWYALRAGTRRAAIAGLIAGACEDVLSAQTGAAWTISTTATAFFAGSLAGAFFDDAPPVLVAAVAVATLLRQFLFWSLMGIEGYPSGYGRVHFHQALWEALLNAALAVAALVAVRVYERVRAAP